MRAPELRRVATVRSEQKNLNSKYFYRTDRGSTLKINSMPESPAINPAVPHPARVYDYWLGGKDNFEADRAVGDQVM